MSISGIDKLVVASHNKGKIKEMMELLTPLGIQTISAYDAGINEPLETEETFEGNALLKALNAANTAQLPAISDDSGLLVKSLNGKPGVFSARWAGPHRDFSLAMQKINNRLMNADRKKGQSVSRAAQFVCALALAWPGGRTKCFVGKIDGRICWPPRGQNGFGYDPIFVPAGSTKTFGQIDPYWKHSISHRAKAFKMLTQSLSEH
tara:strand:- start:190 stop:807 length:618 start_codon:yes stop_codon:yes gene_type:complete